MVNAGVGALAGAAGLAAVAGLAAAWWMYGQQQTARLELRIAIAREAAFVQAARRLADAARISIQSVREEMNAAVRAIAPGIDSVLFFEEFDAALVCVGAYGERAAVFAQTRAAIDDDASPLVAALSCGHRVAAGPGTDARFLAPGDSFGTAIPLVLDAGRRCVLYVAGQVAGSAAVADRIVQLVDQATPAYRIALERADDRARAEYDGLTGLVTARAFRVRLANLIEHARFTAHGRVALLFIDTDRFKAWNDTYGHASGDALLRELAQLLRAIATGDDDIVARNGGDEFCIVFADTEKSSAIERAGRLRASIASADFSALKPLGTPAADVAISASIGVACFPVDDGSPSALLEKADAAMYHTKRTGRDGVSYFGLDGSLLRAETGATLRAASDRRRD